MYHILVVDDEPLICKGLGHLLESSGLPIEQVFMANSGHEAMDYLRMENIDLLVTDIRMDSMSGIELMHQAKLAKPWVSAIVISAYEDFQYARQAIQLGAKEYLLKPLNSEQFLDVVRNELLKLNKGSELPHEQKMVQLRNNFGMGVPDIAGMELLNRLLEADLEEDERIQYLSRIQEEFKLSLLGPYYAVFDIKLDFERSSLQEPLRSYDHYDRNLLQYAVLNIVYETLDKDYRHISIYTQDHGIVVILQWTAEDYASLHLNKIGHLEMIGRTINEHIRRSLPIPVIIGISQMMYGVEHLPSLHKQANKAIIWNSDHHDNYVFYYGDLAWRMYNGDSAVVEINDQVNGIVAEVCTFIQENFCLKGLTLNDIAMKSHVSPNYLSYLFKKVMGLNLWEYVIKLRMEESKRLLMETDMRRYEISERVGYESPEHFSKIFKKYFGISPSAMKK